MTTTAEIAEFALDAADDSLDDTVIDGAKKRVLDAIGIGIAAVNAEPIRILRETSTEMNADGGTSIWGTEMTTSPPLATAINTSMVRYLDFMDSFLVPDDVPHPSNNVAGAIVAGEYADRTGEELISAIAVAYEIHWALGNYAPLMKRGWDHPTYLNFSTTSAASLLMDLDREQLRNALGIAGNSHNTLRVTRTGEIPMWKGMTSGNAARNAVYSTMMAKNGMTGPTDVFEGRQGWKEVVAGDFEVEYTDCQRIFEVMTKKYMAGTHAQSVLEAIEDLFEGESIDPDEIDRIQIDTYEQAKIVMGGTGKDHEMGNRHDVTNRETADHSIPYTVAARILDGELSDPQYDLDRILADDVQQLLRKVHVSEDSELTELYKNGEMPAHVEVELTSGSRHSIEKHHFEGHPKDPMSWEQLEEKFHLLTDDFYTEPTREEIVRTVKRLEEHHVADLTALLGPSNT